MTLEEYIIQKYPSLAIEDFGLKDEGEGATLTHWNSTETQPTDEQVRQWEAEVWDIQKQNPPQSDVEILEAKQALMQKAIDDLILGVMV